VDCPDDFVAAQRRNDALDLPPMAETSDIAVVAALLRSHGRLEPGVVAIAFDQLRGIGERNAAVDEGAIHGASVTAARFPTADEQGQRTVSHMLGLASAAALGMGD